MRTVAIWLAAVLSVVLAACGDDEARRGAAPPGREPSVTVVDGAGVRLAVALTGSADAPATLVLVHGGPGLDRQAMAPFRELSEGRRLVAYDQRGAGESTRPADGDYGLAAHVADLEAVRRAVGAERLALLGQSWGGLVAMAYAARHPERVDDLVLLAAAPPDRAEFVRGQERFAARLAELQRRGLVPDPLPVAPEGSCAALAAVLPVYAADPARPPALSRGMTCSPLTAEETYADALAPADLAAVRAGLGAYGGRALAMMGDRDPFGLGWLDAVAAAVPRAERRVVPDAGHLLAAERPGAVLPVVEEFLSR